MRPHAANGHGEAGGNRALDAICRSGLRPAGGDAGLVAAARRAARVAPDTSLLFLVSGSAIGYDELQRAAASYAPEVRRYAIRVDPAATSRVIEAAGLPVLSLATKDDLPGAAALERAMSPRGSAGRRRAEVAARSWAPTPAQVVDAALLLVICAAALLGLAPTYTGVRLRRRRHRGRWSSGSSSCT